MARSRGTVARGWLVMAGVGGGRRDEPSLQSREAVIVLLHDGGEEGPVQWWRGWEARKRLREVVE